MSLCVGMSIGAVNSVTASMSPTRSRPSVRTRRTALVLDDHGAARVDNLPRFDSAVTDFADLARDPEPLVLGGHLYTAPGLVATVVRQLLDAAEPSSGSVVAYPAVYSDKQVTLLRQALDLAGMREVVMVPEPVAAAAWLEYEHGPLEPGFALVYDLGGASLDVTVVRVGPDWPDHPIVGNPRRCYDFGGRPLGATIARYSRGTAPGAIPLSTLVDVDSLRADHIRDSFDVVRSCLNSTGHSLSDIGRILVIGGASRPPQVAATLAELGRPVITSVDPGQIVAMGAACFAVRSFALAGDAPRPARGAVFSGAAVASALAVSAATMLGGHTDPALGPMLQRYPDLTQPVDVQPRTEAAHTSQVDGDVRYGIPLGLTEPVAGLARNTDGRFVSTGGRAMGPTIAESRGDSHSDPRARVLPLEEESDPARFIHLLPFGWTADPWWGHSIPSAPGSFGAPVVPVSGQVGTSSSDILRGAPAVPSGVDGTAGAGGSVSAPAPVGDGTSGPAGLDAPGDGGAAGPGDGTGPGDAGTGGSGPSGGAGSDDAPAGGSDPSGGGSSGGGDSSNGGGSPSGGGSSGAGDSSAGGASPGAGDSSGPGGSSGPGDSSGAADSTGGSAGPGGGSAGPGGGSAGSGDGSGGAGAFSGGGNSGGGHSDSGGASGGGFGGASTGGPSGAGSAGPSSGGSGKYSGGAGSGNDTSGSPRSRDGDNGSGHGGSGHNGAGRGGGGKGGGGSRSGDGGGGHGGGGHGSGGNGGGGHGGGGSRGR